MSFVNSDSDNNSFGSRNSIRTRRSRSGRRIYPRGNDDYMMPQDPIPFRPRKLVKHQTPQEAIDEFWAKFTTKAPGKATTVIPQNPYTAKVARKNAKATSSSTTTQASYETAAAMCRAKVEKIVQECRRVNKRYRDPHFDLEADLKLCRRDCLESLSNFEPLDNPGKDFRPGSAKRVVEIFDKPQFYIEGPTANDVRQGRDGDCWLMSALCTLSNKKGLIEKLCVAHDQDVGVYGFVFYRDGEWISEIVDDFLYLTKSDYDEKHWERVLFDELERVNPEEAYRKVYQSNSSALYFAQCQHPQETWLPLLEKCYAKAHGDYAAIEGGYGGEGIEDLTGGVTSEIFTTDILDKEYFWKEELLKVNQDFLFGCSTGVWGINWGERKGILELHSYSIQKAVDIDGKRLLRLKNPWGKGEWKGPWSDGSKEWTPEWLEKLDHRFGDDGDFWIAYEDLLQKYQAFERTRLFDETWQVSQIWTTVNVPWMLDYHDTHFSLRITKPGPVVIVLAQLDDRYFRGLHGQYKFELAFRVHKAGHEDYLVRSQAPYRMRRSVNVELDLEAGEYDIRVKIDAARLDRILPIETVIRNNAKKRREKLTRIGLAYDLAHSKGKIVESPEEKAAREAHEKRVKDKEQRDIKEKILERRRDDHHLNIKQLSRIQRREKKRKEKQKAKDTERRLRIKKGDEETDKPDEDGSEQRDQPDENHTVPSSLNGAGASKAKRRSPRSIPPADRFGRSASQGDAPPSSSYYESESDGGLISIESLSELSDHEMDLQVKAFMNNQLHKPVIVTPPSLRFEDELDEFERDPWNAVVVIGLRVYHKVDEEDKTKEVITLKVVRPNPYADSDEDDTAATEEDTKEGQDSKSKGLDVDDSAKDATLEGGVKDRKKSIVGNGEMQ
ncbi:calpain family cysteine protease domain-containing protein [Trichoderma breve]|uniref:Calpain family cysteine protease domain-containing protein n=1 Tax=Trichoderma breve TaxID=2034170 RepID=A0A9W9BE61_9HYPO|nr:calpain family cysteine protease domain-containing protein [Trichoderma breve]KAJ4861505.1 calpain family cysteine protease domain-containing protein [Trichoderma breve]